MNINLKIIKFIKFKLDGVERRLDTLSLFFSTNNIEGWETFYIEQGKNIGLEKLYISNERSNDFFILNKGLQL